MRKIYILLFTLTTLLSNAANYYWVGGNGNWSDLTKWKTTSGGATSHALAPSSSDDVFFDANSFNGNGQTVTVDIAGVCRSMDWTGSTTTYSGNTNGPAILIANSQFNIFGSLKLKAGMRGVLYNYASTIRFASTALGNTITTEGVEIGKNSGANGITRAYIAFTGNGGWTIQDSLIGSMSINVETGSFFSNNKPIRCGEFMSNSSSNVRTIDWGTSTVVVTSGGDMDAQVVIEPTNATLNLASSTLYFAPRHGRTQCWFAGNNGSTTVNFGRVRSTFQNTAVTWYFSYTHNGRSNVTDLIVTGNLFLRAPLTVSDSLFVNAGKQLNITNNYWTQYNFDFGATGKLIANGTCARPIIISGVSGGQYPINLNRSGGWGTTTLDNCIIEGINLLGGGTASANNSINNGGNSNISFVVPSAKNLYWIGGAGNWHDANHWSLTSGGAASGCVPKMIDDVYFDAGSGFTGGSKTVTVDSSIAYCKSMDWTGSANSPIFTCPSSAGEGANLQVYGSLKFISAMTVSLNRPTYFKSSGTANITSAGQVFNWHVYIIGSGTFNLLDAFRVFGKPGGDLWNTGTLYINSGTFNTNNHAVNAREFIATGTTARIINFGNSTVTIDCHETAWGTNQFEMSTDAAVVFNCGQSKLIFNNGGITIDDIWFVGGNKTYNVVQFLNNGTTIPQAQDFTVDSMYFLQKGDIHNNNTVLGQLKLTGGNTYKFDASRTITFSGAAVLYAVGGCDGVVDIQSSSTTVRAIFSKTAGSIGSADQVSLKYMEGAGGATYTATNSSDLGGNVGWTVGAAIPRTIYWVVASGTGTGNWNDNAHWSTASGGAGGQCYPSAIDSVVFDNNSFNGAGQTVTINITDANCKGMNWAGSTARAPIFAGATSTNLNIYGALTFNSGMTQNYLGTVFFKGRGGITSAGKKLNRYVHFDCGSGVYTLQDAFDMQYVSWWAWTPTLNLTSGTLNTNGYTVNLYDINVNSTAATGSFTLNLSNSVLTISNLWNTPGYQNLNSYFNLNAGTSVINLGFVYYSGDAMGTSFSGMGKTFNKVVGGLPNGSVVLHGSATYKVMRLNGNSTISYNQWASASNGNNTVTDSLRLASGKTYIFASGTTQTFNCNTFVDVFGDPGLVITLQSSVANNPAYFTKPCGNVCANYIWVKDIQVLGAAIWRAGSFFDNQGGNSGWNYDPYGTAGNGAMVGGAGPICQGAASTLNFTFTGYAPVTLSKKIVITKSDGSANDTIVCRGDTTLTYNPNSSITYTFFKLSSNDCFIGSSAITGTPTAAFTVKNGAAGTWDGSTSTDWMNCMNWANGALPTSTTDVSITNGLPLYPVISGAGAVCRNLGISSGGSNPSLTINNSASTLAVHGNFALDGTLSHSNGTVTLTGTALNALGGTADYSFYNLAINNSNNISMSRSVTVNNTLTLTSGSLLINSSTLSLLGTVSGSGTLSGTINSILNISGTGALGTIAFASGARQLGNLNLNRTSSGTVTLGSPLSVRSNVNFLNGILITSSSNYLNFDDNATCSNASNSSHVSGPVYKTGNDAFTFPIGKGGNYTWCAITAPSVATDVFSAEFFTADPVATFGSARQADLTSIGLCKYWQVNRVAGTSSVSVQLSWNGSNCGTAIGTPADLRVAHWTGAIWVNEGNGGTNNTGGNTGNIITSNAISSFSPFTIASKSSNNALPIELLSFTATKNKKSVLLNWATATETNNDFFTVERSQNGLNFEALLTKKGAGTTTQRMDYNDVDNIPNKGINYYRLKQTDYDGQFSYSKPISVDFTAAGMDFVVFPNPIKRDYENGITLNIAGLVSDTSVLVVLHDVLGKQYYSKVIVTDGEGKIRLAVESSETLAKGVYMITASSNDELISKKIIIE